MIYGAVYIIKNNLNGKLYVGQTTSFPATKRWSAHIAHARGGNKKPLYSAMRKYGENNFSFEEVAFCADKASLDIAEDGLIKFHDSFAPAGYNLKGGGSNGKHGAVTKAAMKISTKEVLSRPEVKAKHRQSIIDSWTKPGYKEKFIARMNVPSTVRLLSDKAKASWADEDVRAKMMISIAAASGAKSNASKLNWKDPAVREKRIQAQKDAWAERKKNAERHGHSV